jgi:hypothetical protein
MYWVCKIMMVQYNLRHQIWQDRERERKREMEGEREGEMYMDKI